MTELQEKKIASVVFSVWGYIDNSVVQKLADVCGVPNRMREEDKQPGLLSGAQISIGPIPFDYFDTYVDVSHCIHLLYDHGAETVHANIQVVKAML